MVSTPINQNWLLVGSKLLVSKSAINSLKGPEVACGLWLVVNVHSLWKNRQSLRVLRKSLFMAYCLRSFVETLDEVLNPHKYYQNWVLDQHYRPQIQSLFENATFLQDFLYKSSPLIQEKIASLKDQIMDAAQEAADTLEIIITDQIHLNPGDQSFTIIPPDLGHVIWLFEYAKQEISDIKNISQSWNNEGPPPVSTTHYQESFLTAYCLRSFVETLDQVLNPHKYFKKWVLDQFYRPEIQSLFENATFLQDFLDKSSPFIQERIASLENQIMEAAQEAADTLETIITDQILLNPGDQSFTIIPPDFGKVIWVLEDAKQEMSKIKNASQQSWNNEVPSPVSTTRYPDSKMVVGLEKDLDRLRDRVMSDQKELDIIPIVGMGGIGKTTLARILYDEFSSKSHFDRCAWVTVSQSYDPHQILKTILDCVTKNKKPQKITRDLTTALYKALCGLRYLIVLDDIWSSEAWYYLRNAFAREKQGSRIIFTTRENSLVDYVKSSSHKMHLINNDNSWEVLRAKIFGEESCPRELEEVGKRIALKCGGLPLALQVIGGLLAHSKRHKDLWKYVADNVSSLIAKTDDQFTRIFSWSFAHLPHYLKPCFLYMSAFPEDVEIPASKLIKLWIAEGFLYQVPDRCLEESAEIHLKSLVDRSLIFVCTWRWNGKAKSYGIHDLLRDLCLRKAKEEKFLYVRDPKTIFLDDVLGLRRISNHQSYDEWDEYLNLTSFTRSFQMTHSFARNKNWKSCLCYESSLLRVLNVNSQGTHDFPKIFLSLVNLRYLCGNSYKNVRGISVLTNLQTLIVWEIVSLEILEYLPQLRHLQFRSLKDSSKSFETPHENLLYLSNVDWTPFLGKLPNLTKLSLNVDSSLNIDNVVDLTCFQKLLNLTLVTDPRSVRTLTLPPSLKKLKIIWGKINETLLDEIGFLPRLQFLRLQSCEFENGMWEPIEGQFCQLQILEIRKSSLVNWLADATHFPVLRHLVLESCFNLSEIPYDIGGIETLETIKLGLCKESVFDSARALLKEQQLDLGNNLLKLQLGKSLEEEKLEYFGKKGLIIANLPPSRADQSAEMKNPASPHFTGNSTSSAGAILKEQLDLGNNLLKLQLGQSLEEENLEEYFRKKGFIIANLPPSRADQSAEMKNPASPHFTGNSTSSARAILKEQLDLGNNLLKLQLGQSLEEKNLEYFREKGLIIANLPPSRADQSAEMKNPASPHFTGNSTSSVRKGSHFNRAKRDEALRKFQMEILKEELDFGNNLLKLQLGQSLEEGKLERFRKLGFIIENLPHSKADQSAEMKNPALPNFTGNSTSSARAILKKQLDLGNNLLKLQLGQSLEEENLEYFRKKGFIIENLPHSGADQSAEMKNPASPHFTGNSTSSARAILKKQLDLGNNLLKLQLSQSLEEENLEYFRKKGFIIANLPPSRADQSAEMKNLASPHFTGNSTSSARAILKEQLDLGNNVLKLQLGQSLEEENLEYFFILLLCSSLIYLLGSQFARV